MSTDKMIELIQQYGLPLIWGLLIFVIGRMVAKIITNVIGSILTKSNVDETLIKFSKSISYIGLMLFVILATLEKVGIQTTSFAAVIAAAGLAIGFALQGSLSNFASGVMLIVFRPFKAGDFVEVNGISGVVEEIQIFTTQLKSPDNKRIIIPNGQVTSASIINYSSNPTRRVDLVIGVGYDDDIKKTKELLEEILNSEDRILEEPEATIGLLELGENSVNFAVRPWVNTEDYWPVYFALQEEIKVRFDENEISFPYPQRDVHMRIVDGIK